jgi:hypothetical protein
MSEYEEKMYAQSKKQTQVLYACFAALCVIAGALLAN